MNLPNFLTIARLFMVPCFVFCYVQGSNGTLEYGIYFAAVLFIVAALTDILDGYIARKYNQITDFGKLADPLADKMMQLAAIACLTFYGRIALWILIVYVVKELLLIIGGARLLKVFKYVVYSKWSGKVATVLLFICIVAIMIFPEISASQASWMMGVCVFFTLIALFNYMKMYANVKESRQHKNENKE
ncbi:MAG: CDP-diacylglycerol--glycerol-3-phosphate 3-phosphatidyltransferase [Clostridia bacterium]|nr:CDP-diacylglycerol--glycerol-3-phosphate 3-phosphatidyltransferase [Clostridia bacterium]